MIPKTIHYCWFGGNPKPKSVIKCIKSWRKKCPDYEIIEWNESNYDITQNRYMKEAYGEKKWSFVSDFARLDIIFRYGGIYLDTDVQIIKGLDSLLDCRSYYGFQFNNCIALGLGFGAEPGNELVEKLLRSYDSLSFYNEDGSLNINPITVLTAPVFEDYGFVLNNCYQNIEGNIVYPIEYFDPKYYWTGMIQISEKTISIHHYDATWFPEWKQKQKLNRWKQAKLFHIKRTPNRCLLKLLGQDRYNQLKRLLKNHE